MIKKIIIIMCLLIITISCGKKGNPVFQALKQDNITVSKL